MKGLIEGRMVHYVFRAGNLINYHLPAVVSLVWKDEKGNTTEDGLVNLHVFQTRGDPVVCIRDVSYSPKFRPGTWHWIEETEE